MHCIAIDDELMALIRAMEREQARYALCGALALAVHGAPRATCVSREGLIALKTTAGRLQDLADIERLGKLERDEG